MGITFYFYFRCWISNAESAVWTFIAPAALIMLVSYIVHGSLAIDTYCVLDKFCHLYYYTGQDKPFKETTYRPYKGQQITTQLE